MNKISTRVITLFVLFSLMFANVGLIGTVPVMAQAASTQAPTTVVDQQVTAESPTVETTAAPTDLPATLAAPSVTPTSAAASDTPTVEELSATPTTTTPTLETPASSPTVEPTLTSTPTGTSAPDISASSTSYDCTAQSDIPLIECQALVALYNSTGGSSWTNHADWLVTNTPCSWPGVTCSSGHVTSLDLHNNNLRGTLPIQLGNLAGLQVLDLDTNHLSGSIPTQLSNLTDLKELVLNNNQFSGSIPTQLGNLTGLEELILNVNKLTGSIPSQLGNLTNLVVLDLGSNQLSGSIPSVLGNLTTLQTLSLGNNLLSGGIPSQLGNLTGLQTLDLSSNKLTGSIPTELGDLNILNWINLSTNQLTGNIPTEFGNLTQLQNLFINSNLLSGSLPVSLDNITGLHFFYFYNTSLCEPNDVSFQTWLTSIAHLIGTIHCGANISGKVTLGSGGLQNVKIVLGAHTTTTAADGSFTLTNVAYGTSASIIPSLAGYTFSPAFIPISKLPGDLAAQDFSATQFTYKVSGKISGPVASGVTVSDGTNNTTSDSSGNYSLTEPYGASIVLTPSLAGYIFNPTKTAINNIKANQTGKNFTSIIAYTISGTVTNTSDSSGLAGVKVAFNSIYTATTDSSGNYTILNIPKGKTGDLIPFEAGFSFNPVKRTVSSALAGNMTGQDFSATALPNTYSISGKVTTLIPSKTSSSATTSIGLPGVSVTLGKYSAITDSNGNYTISSIAPNSHGQLNASKSHYSFNSKTINALTADLTGVNFGAVQLIFTVYGKVYSSQQNLAHVKIHVTANGVPTKDGLTDSSGQYFLRNMPSDNDYVLTPELPGYSFKSVDTGGSSVTLTALDDNSSQDFKGTLHFETLSGTVSNLGNTTIQIRYGESKTQFVTTAADGSFTINNLPQSASYTLTPISPLPPNALFRFDPLNRIIPAGSGDLSLQDFTAAPQVIMSGSVTVQSKPISGVIISLPEYSFISVKTDAHGKYSVWVPSGVSITPTATQPYFKFTDTVATDSHNQDFTQSWSAAEVIVTGQVNLYGSPLTGVLLSASTSKGGTPASAVSGAGGYKLTVHDTDTPNLANFVVTPSLTGYNFSPSSKPVNPGSGTLKNFSAIVHKWSVSGKVTVGLSALKGVEIDASIDSVVHKLFTNSAGAFTLTGVPYGASVSLSAKKYCYTFSTINTYPTDMGDGNLTGQNFSASALNLDRSISGVITIKDSLSVPLANVLLTLTYHGDTIFSARSNSNGYYNFPNLVEDSGYVVTPTLTNYIFDTENLAVDLTSTTAFGQNFSATRVAKISGRIYGLPANTPSVDFNIGPNSAAPGASTIPVDSLGRYVILVPNLPVGNSYTVTPLPGGPTSGYNINPASFTFPIGPTTTLIVKNFTAVP